MTEPWMIITGATGFLGGQLVRQLRKEYRIYAIGRRTPGEAGAPEGEGIEWFQADIGRIDQLQPVFSRIRDQGGADLLLHMAAYYDFTGEDNPEYIRTNVEGTRNLLDLSIPLGLRRFIYASSVAACPFPEPGSVVDEETPPTAPVPYARSKQRCETMLHELRDSIPSCIVRPAAVFSQWSEYEPLTEFLQAWCSHGWNARVIGGRGESAIPYLHVRDLLSFFVRVVERCDELGPAEVLIASPDGSTSHLELFLEATRCRFGAPRSPIHVPPSLARRGVRAREWLGRLTRRMPFERSWMIDYFDRRLDIDASRTRRRLDWAPDPAHAIVPCISAMVENLRRSASEWRRMNELRRKSRRSQRHRDRSGDVSVGELEKRALNDPRREGS